MDLSPINGLKSTHKSRLAQLNPGEVLIVGDDPPTVYKDNVRIFVESEAPRFGIDVSALPDNMEEFVWLAYSGNFLGDGQVYTAMLPIAPTSDLVTG